MEMKEVRNKCVLIIDSELPVGLIANTACILGITLGYRHSNMIGEDITDASQQSHSGITNVPIPILKGNKEKIKQLLEEIRTKYDGELTVVDFSETAQCCTDYNDYIEKVHANSADDFQYLGIGIYGPMKIINKLTGSMPLLR